MKHLTTAKPGPTPIPPELGVSLLQASKAWIDAKIADGTIDVTYLFFGGGGLSIGNADSHEEILADLLEYPLYPFFVWEVVPLLDYEESLDKYITFNERLASLMD